MNDSDRLANDILAIAIPKFSRKERLKYKVTMILEYPNAEPQNRIRHETFQDIELSRLSELIPDEEDINVLGVTARRVPSVQKGDKGG